MANEVPSESKTPSCGICSDGPYLETGMEVFGPHSRGGLFAFKFNLNMNKKTHSISGKGVVLGILVFFVFNKVLTFILTLGMIFFAANMSDQAVNNIMNAINILGLLVPLILAVKTEEYYRKKAHQKSDENLTSL